MTGPLLTFFMGRSRAPIESLAVLPVVQSLVFLFRSGGVAFQEVGVALSGRRHEHEREVGRASLLLAAAATAALALMLFTPLEDVWLRQVSGLSPELAGFALTPARLLLLLPAMEYWLSFQRSRFILNGQTRVITAATACEVGGHRARAVSRHRAVRHGRRRRRLDRPDPGPPRGQPVPARRCEATVRLSGVLA